MYLTRRRNKSLNRRRDARRRRLGREFTRARRYRSTNGRSFHHHRASSTRTRAQRLERHRSVAAGVHGAHVQGGDAHAAYFDAYDEDKDLQELEDLLETYFTHVDSTHRSLNGLNEYIDDLEDLIEIELDSQRNQLIKLELIFTTATLSLTCFSVVVGIFGMNIKNNIENEHDAFLFVAWFGTAGTVGMFLLLLRVVSPLQTL